MSVAIAADRRCFLVHGNRAADGVLSGGNWGGTLDDLLLPTLREDVARCTTGVLGDAVFTWQLGKVMTVGAMAIVGHTLPGGAKARLTWSRAGVAVGAAAEWQAVFPRVSRTLDLSFDDAGWWTGRPSAQLRAVYTPSFLVIPDVRLRADAVTVEIDARGQAFDLSYLFVASLFRPDWPMAWGREVEPVSRSIADLTPGGRLIHDRRRPLRRQRVTFEDLSKDEAGRWIDISMTHDVVDPLLFVPDPGDPRNWWREVFLARLTKLTGFTEKDDGYYRVSVEIEEIIA